MEKAINIICGIVIIAVASFFAYTLHQKSLRQKELDKKRSDCLDKEKDVLELTKQFTLKQVESFSKNGKTKTKQHAKKEVAK